MEINIQFSTRARNFVNSQHSRLEETEAILSVSKKLTTTTITQKTYSRVPAYTKLRRLVLIYTRKKLTKENKLFVNVTNLYISASAFVYRNNNRA